MREVRRVVDWFDKRRAVPFDIREGLVGGAAIDAQGTPIADATMEQAMDAHAVVMGAVSGPNRASRPFALTPERGLLPLAKDMQPFAKLSPPVASDARDATPSLQPRQVGAR